MSSIQKSRTFITACRNHEIGAEAIEAGEVDISAGLSGKTPLHKSKLVACVADLKELVLNWVKQSLLNEQCSCIGRKCQHGLQ